MRNTVQLLVAMHVVALAFARGEAANVGMIVEIRGDVALQAKGAKTWTKATMMKALAQGDRLRTKAKAKATVVFFANGRREQLQPDCQITIEKATCKVITGPKTKELPKVAPTAARRLSGTKLGSGRSGSVLIRGGPPAVELRTLFDTATLDAQPVFRWHASGGFEEFKVLVHDESDQLVWSGNAKESSLRYPEDAPSLSPGKQYFWELEARRPPRRPKIVYGMFTILDPKVSAEVRAQAAKLRPKEGSPPDASSLVLLTGLYAEHGLWDDAIRLYEQLAREFPKDTEIRKRLTTLLKNQGRSLPASRSTQ